MCIGKRNRRTAVLCNIHNYTGLSLNNSLIQTLIAPDKLFFAVSP